MDTAIRRLRSQARQLARGKGRTAVRYPAAFRNAVVRLVRTRRGPGRSVERLARALGISSPTLAHWLRPPARPVLRPIALVPEPRPEPARPTTSVVLITPHGLRVEGLDCDGLIAVLRALS
jgi:hypothetical protein